MWGRHAVLAEAFCVGDERVREAQARLDEAQADRLRVLAAFAVTVGSAGAVADLFGLSEREVRVARRTVGKEDARAVADELLSAAAASAVSRASAGVSGAGVSGAGGVVGDEGVGGEGAVSESGSVAVSESVSGSGSVVGSVSESVGVSGAVGSSSGGVGEGSGGGLGGVGELGGGGWGALDAVLVGSWQTGVDLRDLAVEFGLDLGRLRARAQQLSALGRLPSGVQEGYGGRHRRPGGEVSEGEWGVGVSQSGGWGGVSSGQAVSSGWYPGAGVGESVAEVAALPADWDQALAAWGQFAAPYEEPSPSPSASPAGAGVGQPWAQYHLSS
ncbi:hypothetical protein [Streptomyces halobius]|uniref:hypothetical protein n=1 Tax=Streptomyces halobius TaxID=2879846 RepID=UPI0038733392